MHLGEVNAYLVDSTNELLARLPARRNADALPAFGFDPTDEETARLDAPGMPVVYVSRHAQSRPSVYVDDVAT